jgi:hypothetical protein
MKIHYKIFHELTGKYVCNKIGHDLHDAYPERGFKRYKKCIRCGEEEVI